MNDDFYKKLIEELPTGYAYHKIICDEAGIPCDYEFIEVNSAFEALTGLKGSDIIGRKITEVLPDITKSEFDWIKFYGEIAINGEKKVFEQFLEPVKRWYRVNAYSPKKYYFITHFIDVSKENVKVIESENLQEIVNERELEYKIIADYAYDWETWEDETGKLKYISYACERTSGYTVDDFLENESLFASLIVEEEQEKWADHRHNIEFNKGVHSEQFRIRNKNGEIVWIEHTCRPVIAENGMCLGYRANNRDITERKQAEDELQESKNFLTALLESIPAPVFYKDTNGRYLGFNRAYEEFFGKTKEELIGKSVFDISPENLARIYHAKDAELFERPGTQTYETQVEDARGVLHDVVFYKATMVNSRGKVTGLTGTVLDITDRKQAENALKKSEEKYRLIFEHTPLGVLHFDNTGRIIDCNDNFVKIIGSSREVLVGLDISKLPDENIVEALREALQGHMTTYEGVYKSFSADKITPLRVLLAPILSDHKTVEAGVGIVEDISERKRLETALSNEKSLLKVTLISVGDGVISTDNKGNIVFLNRATEFLTGWTQEAASGKPYEEIFNIVNEFTREKSENLVKKVLESGKILELADNTLLISKDGIERHIEDSAAPIVQENGEIVGVVVVFRDITERKERRKKILYLSYHDQLTNLYNRRFYEEEIKRLDIEINLPMTIVMGDVNGLKLVNDSFGHAMGDELLKKVADVITKGCRADDIIARLGGDEFVIILPKTDAFEAEQIIKRITDLALSEKVGLIDISISFGYETKTNKQEDIQEILKNAEDHMYTSKIFESPSMRGKTINAIIKALYEKNTREEQHSRRVSRLCEGMGKVLSLSERGIEELKAVGLLHDIGKIAIDECILNKPGKFTDDEWKEIKRHSEIGYRILNTVNDMSAMAQYVLFHHERWDGTGYPKGLKGEEIPLQSRIIAVADAYDAMSSERSYRSALPEAIVIEELQKNSGLQFDPDLVKLFIDKILDPRGFHDPSGRC